MKLPVGISDFRKIIELGYEFIDKSLFIEDIINDAEVVLITRPRRFGKTLQLSMLKYFFSNAEEDKSNKRLFENLYISNSKPQILSHFGKYPVVFLSLKDIKEDNFIVFQESFTRLISKLYSEHAYILTGSILQDAEKNIYEKILNREAKITDLKSSLRDLSEYLARYHKINPVILIDEYDTPIQHAYSKGFYDEIISLFKPFLGAALKDNPYLFKAVLTGILRISKESLFSGLNNIEVYPLTRPAYSSYFGFTEEEVSALLKKVNLTGEASAIRNWYNGYRVGDTIIYNPWSIINCIKQEGELQPYWINTSDNILIKELLIHSSTDFKRQFESLLQNVPIETIVDDHLVLQYLNANETAIWTLFLMAGYLKVVEKRRTDQGLVCTVAIPNREVRNLYRQIIETWLSDGRTYHWYNQFLRELLSGNISQVERYLNDILLKVASVYDMAREPEAFYHGLMLGLTASLHNDYDIKSNHESGYGFYDIAILPKDNKKLGIVIELKVAEDTQLEKMAQAALKQIWDKQYTVELSSRGIKNILNVGIAFSGKRLKIESKMNG